MVSKSPVGRNGFTQFIGPGQFLSPRISLAFSQLIVGSFCRSSPYFYPTHAQISDNLCILLSALRQFCPQYVFILVYVASYFSVVSRVGLSTHAEADVPPQLQPISPTVTPRSLASFLPKKKPTALHALELSFEACDHAVLFSSS